MPAGMLIAAFWIFWVTLTVLVYVYVGYFSVMALLALVTRATEHAETTEPTVTIIIPAYNEAVVLKTKLENALALSYPQDKLEIIVANDASDDQTEEIAGAFEVRGVRVMSFSERRGKASVLNDAVRRASGDVICACDANVMLEPDALKLLVSRLADPEVGAVTGLVRLASQESNFGHGEGFYYRLERAVQSAESRLGSLMGVDGGMFVMRKELFQPLPPDTVLDDFVISMRVLRQGKRVVYEPRAVANENGTPKAMQEFRRRVRVSAGAAQVLRRGEFPSPRHPILFWQFLSHKLLRWMGPLFLLALLISNAVLWPVGAFYRAALIGQLVLYLLAAVAAVSLRFRKTRLGAIPFYFVMSHVAMAVGLVRGLLNRQKVTWVQADRRPTITQQEDARLS